MPYVLQLTGTSFLFVHTDTTQVRSMPYIGQMKLSSGKRLNDIPVSISIVAYGKKSHNET